MLNDAIIYKPHHNIMPLPALKIKLNITHYP